MARQTSGSSRTQAYPLLRQVGLNGMLVTFSRELTDDGNRAALSFRAALAEAGWEGIEETSASLASAFLRFDPERLSHADLSARLEEMLAQRDWYASDLPAGRRLWRIPTVYGTDLAPQLGEAAAEAGFSEAEAVERLSAARVRVLTIGFAPGQPYLGPLGPEWNLPRQKTLTASVPEGALVLAISQLVLFAASTPTGWRHVGQTAFRCFRPETPEPFALNPGDELMFEPVTASELAHIRDTDLSGNGGATCEAVGT